MRKQIILQNGSKEEADRMFDEIKSSISDFSKESVTIGGNLRFRDRGWRVTKIFF
jgi:hypothetical protein